MSETTFKRYAKRDHKAYYKLFIKMSAWSYHALVYRLSREYTMLHDSLKEMNQ